MQGEDEIFSMVAEELESIYEALGLDRWLREPRDLQHDNPASYNWV